MEESRVDTRSLLQSTQMIMVLNMTPQDEFAPYNFALYNFESMTIS